MNYMGTIFNRDFMEKNLPCRRRDSNPRPSDPWSFTPAVALLTAFGHLPPIPWARTSSQYLGGSSGGRQQAALVFPRPDHPGK